MTTFKLFKISAILIFTGLLAGCATVSFERPKSYSTATLNTENTALSKTAARKTAQYDGRSAFYPIEQGMDALGARLRLAEKAEKSIDMQYFLMKHDTAGIVMTNALLKSADRGVRIRFLLDDVFTTVPDRSFLLINQHPNIEIRIFNPISRRGIYALNFIAQFDQANRRMHNKSFTVDNSISIVGGRNIGNEYFEISTDAVFVDLDVLAVGPIVPEISKAFDKYWNHSRAVPIEQFTKNYKKEYLANVRADIAEEFDGIYDTVYKQALNSQLLKDLINDRVPLFPAHARILTDSPDKLTSEIDEKHQPVVNYMRKALLSAETEVVLLSPYFVPRDQDVQIIRDLVAKGVRVVVLTNSLASNNHVAAHSGYARYRRDVIGAGAELYEVRANAAHELNDNTEGPHTLTLHSKLIIIDRKQVFVGSPNIDPRSLDLNAEMGILIDSETIADELTQNMEQTLATLTYRVRLNDRGKLEWYSRIDNQDVIETKEPLTGWWRRFKAWFMKIVPESQL
jgi:putative cardiolipin synthase